MYATATEDMDALCCGSPVLVRRLTFSEARKLPVLEYRLEKVLEELKLNMTQFVDFCILCGCDFAGTIKVCACACTRACACDCDCVCEPL